MKTMKPSGWEALAPLIVIRKEFGLSQALIANHARAWQSDISRAETGLVPAISERFIGRYRASLISLIEEIADQGCPEAKKTLRALRAGLTEIKQQRGRSVSAPHVPEKRPSLGKKGRKSDERDN